MMLRQFLSDHRGNLPVVTAVLLIPMLIMTGAGIDFMRHEIVRSKLQDSLDRGVLAAASLNQTKEAEETVLGYLKAARLAEGVKLTVDDDRDILNVRRVSAEASISVPMTFLRLIRLEELGAVASSTAEERRQRIELSLLLDVSGSMRFNDRIGDLKPAATKFIDAMLAENRADYTSISIVPYAGQVSVGRKIFDLLVEDTDVRKHPYSSCFEFKSEDYGPGIPNFKERSQAPHFTHSNHHDRLKKDTWDVTNVEPWWCPDDPHTAPDPTAPINTVGGKGEDTDDTTITFLSSDAGYLKRQVENLKMYDGTGTAIAMKWGTILLDPTVRPLLALAASQGLIPGNFSNTSEEYWAEEPLRFIVLMTDGEISAQWEPKNDANVQYSNADNTRREYENAGKTKANFKKTCETAEASKIVVFTIAFDLDESTSAKRDFKKLLKDCASSESHYYDVKGLNIDAAFQSIASAIQKIKLVNR